MWNTDFTHTSHLRAYYTLCHHHHPTPPIHTFVLISDAVQRDTRLDAVQTIEPPLARSGEVRFIQNLSELKSLDRSVLTQHSWLQGDIEILMSSLHDRRYTYCKNTGDTTLTKKGFSQTGTPGEGILEKGLDAPDDLLE